MSKLSPICASCGCDAFEKESGCRVCTNCGTLLNNSHEFADDPLQTMATNDTDLFKNQALHASIRRGFSTSDVTPCQKMAIEVAEMLASNFNFQKQMKDYLMENYKKALHHEHFLKCSQRSKEILAAVCAYVTLMNFDNTIAIECVCNAVGCDGYQFKQIQNQLLADFPQLKPSGRPIEELVPSIVHDYKFDADEVQQLEQRVINMICIEKACWLVDGRSPIHLINAAIFLGWKSIKPYARAKVRFHQFCETVGMKQHKTTHHRVKELTSALIRLANFLPAVDSQSIQINKNNIALYIDDVLRYSNSLIYDLQMTLKESNKKKKTNGYDDDYFDDENWMKSFKRTKPVKKIKSINDGRREDNNVANDDPDISDTEINSYLRSETEVEFIKKLRKKSDLIESKKRRK